MWLLGGFLSGLAHGRWRKRARQGLPNSAGDTISFGFRALAWTLGAVLLLCVVAAATSIPESIGYWQDGKAQDKYYSCMEERYGPEEETAYNPATGRMETTWPMDSPHCERPY